MKQDYLFDVFTYENTTHTTCYHLRVTESWWVVQPLSTALVKACLRGVAQRSGCCVQVTERYAHLERLPSRACARFPPAWAPMADHLGHCSALKPVIEAPGVKEGDADTRTLR